MPYTRIIWLLVGLLAFGALKLPFERQLNAQYRAAHFLQSQITMDVRAQTGQMGFVAALSGFRALVADVVWIRAYMAWENTEWGRMKFLMDAATSLQPRALMFWDTAAWHMAWNASISALNNKQQPVEALRIKAQQEYIRLGEDYLLRGITYNPDRALLYDRLGLLYAEKMKDPCKSSAAYAQAAERPDAMQYVHRFAVYQLAKCPGHEQEALVKLRELYHRSEYERLPTLLRLLDDLQTKLNVPAAERIDITEDLKQATPRMRGAGK